MPMRDRWADEALVRTVLQPRDRGSRVRILGVGIDPVTMEQAVQSFHVLIRRRPPSLVCNLHVHLCMEARRDPELRAIYDAADLVLVDGTPMMWAARFLGTPLPERVSGSDFVPVFCRHAAEEGFAIFLLGAGPGIADRAKRWLEEQNPRLRVAGTYAPPFGFELDDDENNRIVEMVRRARPDVLFAAFGPVKQEKWLFRFYRQMDVPVAMGIGSTLDYLAGRLRRAPMWMQRAGLEWSYRLVQEPRRLWRRYLIEDPPFVYHVMKQRWGTRVDGTGIR